MKRVEVEWGKRVLHQGVVAAGVVLSLLGSAHAGGETKGNVTINNKIKNGVGAIAGRDAVVGSLVVQGGSVKGDVTVNNDIKNGAGAIAGRDAIVGSVVVKQ